MPNAAESFRDFEHEGWERAADVYRSGFMDVTAQAVDPLLDAVGAARGTALLDVATGPGHVAAGAAERGARVTGLDFAAAMLEIARARHPDITFEQGDAEALPFADDSFDAVVCAFGMLHFAHPERAMAESYRVLRRSGRVAFTVWAPPNEALMFGIVRGAIETHGRIDVPLPDGPAQFRFSDPAECRAVLGAAGFSGIDVRRIRLVWRLDSADRLFDIVMHGSVRTAAVLRAQTETALVAIRKAMGEEVARYRNGEVYELPMPAVMASAAKR
jgi:SAM-dependent methyltransferase